MNSLILSDTTTLEKIKLTDAEIIFETIDRNRDFLKEWLPFVEFTHGVANTKAFIKSLLEIQGPAQPETFTIWFKGNFAGLIGFKDPDIINHRTEIGYWLDPKMQGKGIITQAAKALTNYAFEQLGMNRIQIRCGVGNTKSSAIPKRLGYHFESIEREGEFHLDHYIDLEVYSILKKEWAKINRCQDH